MIARERWRIKACFNEALELDPKAAGTFELRFSVDAAGAVTQIALESSSGTPSLGECLARSLLAVRFAPLGHSTEFTVPIVLNSVGAPGPKVGPMTCKIIEAFEACEAATIDDAALGVLAQKKPESVFVVLRPESQTSVATLTRWPAVRHLILFGAPIEDISSLSALGDLETLALNETKVTGLTALSSMTKLRVLDVKASPVADLSALAKLTTLEKVFLRGTAVREIWPLLGSAKSLKHLVIPKAIPDSALASFRAVNPAIVIEAE